MYAGESSGSGDTDYEAAAAHASVDYSVAAYASVGADEESFVAP